MSSFEELEVIIGVVQVLATMLIAVAVVVQAERLKSADIGSLTRDAFNTMNSVALNSSANLKAFDSLGRPHTSDTDETRRKRWCAFVWLVTLQEIYTAGRMRLFDRKFAYQTLVQQLEIILKDDLVFWLVLNRGFNPRFAVYCRSIRQRIAPEKPLVYSEEEALHGLHSAV